MYELYFNINKYVYGFNVQISKSILSAPVQLYSI